jgi:two-component system response regulator AtoC
MMKIEGEGKLLRVLQDGEYVKLGSNQRHKADVRFIAATNEDLDNLMARKLFRKDLYYRIRGGWLHLPPLRERREDILLLANHFIHRFGGAAVNSGIEAEAAALLSAYGYPGNIRELQSIVRSALNLAQGRPIATRHLPAALRPRPTSRSSSRRCSPGSPSRCCRACIRAPVSAARPTPPACGSRRTAPLRWRR